MPLSDWTQRRIDEAVRKVEQQLTDLVRQFEWKAQNQSRVPLSWYNKSSVAAPPYGLIALTGGGQLDPGSRTPYSLGWRPGDQGSAAIVGYAINEGLQVPATGPGAYGQCYVPATWVKVAYDTGTPHAGEVWGPKGGQWQASYGGSPGCLTVVGVLDSTAQLMLCLLGSNNVMAIGRMTSTLAPGGSCTVELYGGAAGSESDLGQSITAYDWLMYPGQSPIVPSSGNIVTCVCARSTATGM